MDTREQRFSQNLPPRGFASYDRYLREGGPNVSLGPVELKLSAYTSLNWSDNFLHTQHSRLESLSLTAGIIADGQWQLTSDQVLGLNLGIGLDYWLDGPGNGSAETGDVDFSIIPESELHYTIFVGRHISIELYDQFQILRNRDRNEYSLDTEAIADLWMNAAGVRLTWEMNDRTTVETDYEIGRRQSLDDANSRIDYDWQSASLRLARNDGEAKQIGIEAAASWADYIDSRRNDSNSISLGLFGQWLLSDYTSVYATAGIKEWDSSGSDILYKKWDHGIPKSILVTSAIPFDGKSTVASNLAAALSMSGATVLLVDADLQRGALHQRFQTDEAPGLGNVLTGTCPVSEAIVESDHANLDLLPRGNATTATIEFIAKQSTQQLFLELEAVYDYIVVDSAPVLVADDTLSLVPLVDTTLFVIRLNRTPGRLAERGLAYLEQRQVALGGVILNSDDTYAEEYYAYNYAYNYTKCYSKVANHYETASSVDQDGVLRSPARLYCLAMRATVPHQRGADRETGRAMGPLYPLGKFPIPNSDANPEPIPKAASQTDSNGITPHT